MRAVVGFPSYAALAVWSAIIGTWDPASPIDDLTDLVHPRRMAKASSAGEMQFSFNLPALAPIGLVSLVHHNLSAAAAVRLKLYDAGFGPPLYDSGYVSPPAPFAAYPQTFPMLVPSPQPILRGTLDIIPGSGDPNLLLGGVDVAGAYLWPDLIHAQQRGLDPRGQRIQQPGGGDANMRQWSPRTFAGSREVVTRAELETSVLDFQKDTGLSAPFVFVRDIDTASTWVRECFLARNKPLGTSSVYAPENGRHVINLVEHLG